jgi:phage anti-repressor protein
MPGPGQYTHGQVGKRFTTWIIAKLQKYGFVEGEDFLPILGETSEKGGRPTTEYRLTVDVAKELAMLQDNEIGRDIRKYFIVVEKAWRESQFKELDTMRNLDMDIEIATRENKLQEASIRHNANAIKALGILKQQCATLGFDKQTINDLIVRAKTGEIDPNVEIRRIVDEAAKIESDKRRNRISFRVNRLSDLIKTLYPDRENHHQDAWHLLIEGLQREFGFTVSWKKRREADTQKINTYNALRKPGEKKKEYPSYLDYIEEYHAHKIAERILKRRINKFLKIAAEKGIEVDPEYKEL